MEVIDETVSLKVVDRLKDCLSCKIKSNENEKESMVRTAIPDWDFGEEIWKTSSEGLES